MDKKTLIGLGIITALVIIVAMLFGKVNDLKETIRVDKTNISALNDTLKTYQLKNNTVVAEKQAFYSDLQSLKSVNKALYDSINYYQKALKIKASTVQVVGINGKIETKYDTIKVDRKVISDSVTEIKLVADKKDGIVSSHITALLEINFKADSLRVVSYSLNNITEINGLSLNIITGYRKSGLFSPSVQYVSDITTNDKRFKISKIDSWINKDFEKNRYLSLKPGLFTGMFYDPFYKHFSLGIGFGLTLQYIK
jgi:hypothetical protein